MNIKTNIKRLLQYRFCLIRLKELGFEKVFSYTLSEEAGVSAEQVRKDFSQFGIKGNKKAGYVIDQLIETFDKIFISADVQNVILVGMGNIGKALSQYRGFKQGNLNLVAAFDIDPSKQVKSHDIPVYPVEMIPEMIGKFKVEVAIIAVPSLSAQYICDNLISNGIKGIMNFAPVILKVPKDVLVNNINLSNELQSIVHCVTKKLNCK
ncbi:redox-sensing transcriptional repressor Rex [Bacteroidota bacterium]